MATQFGVSRAIIREAIARLKNEGLVKTRQGSGAYVRDNDITSLKLDPDIRKSLESVLAIVELRKGIEAEAAALAAERRSRKELARIERALAQHRPVDTARQRQLEGGHPVSPRDRGGRAQSLLHRGARLFEPIRADGDPRQPSQYGPADFVCPGGRGRAPHYIRGDPASGFVGRTPRRADPHGPCADQNSSGGARMLACG